MIAEAVEFAAASGELTVAAALAGTDNAIIARDIPGVAALLARLPSTDAVATVGLYGVLLAWRSAALPAALRQFQIARAGATQAMTRLQQAVSRLENLPEEGLNIVIPYKHTLDSLINSSDTHSTEQKSETAGP